MDKASKIYVAGHRGLVGSALCRELNKQGFTNLVYRTHEELDLLDQKRVRDFFCTEKPEYVLLAAAKVGGIYANKTYPAEFIYENLMIQNHVIEASYLHDVKGLLFLGSSCIYPRDCPQPIKESSFLTGPLEKTNEAYAVAKIAGVKLCQSYNQQYKTNYLSVMPTNLYGLGDNYDANNSHVLPAMIRKCHEAKLRGDPVLTLWGTGKPRRELLYADDMANACVLLMQTQSTPSLVNIGSGEDMTVQSLAFKVKSVVGYEGELRWDNSMPDGTPRKVLDVSYLTGLGWKPAMDLMTGIKRAYEDFLSRYRAT